MGIVKKMSCTVAEKEHIDFIRISRSKRTRTWRMTADVTAGCTVSPGGGKVRKLRFPRNPFACKRIGKMIFDLRFVAVTYRFNYKIFHFGRINTHLGVIVAHTEKTLIEIINAVRGSVDTVTGGIKFIITFLC